MKQQYITRLVEGMLSGGLGPNEAHQIRDPRTNLMIPSVLVTMKRLGEETDEYNIEFATPRIAQIVADVQETQRWTNSWETLTLSFRNSETPLGNYDQVMWENGESRD
jgi:hypothetical protein